MSKQWQIRRGTTAENNEFTGAVGEITMDTDKNQIRIHDGTTQGGHIFGDTVVEWQVPTAENNYTWYRKYRSGWVEQGQTRVASSDQVIQITFPVEMADTYYVWSIGRHIYDVAAQNVNERYMGVISRTTTGFSVSDQWGHTYAWCWQVSGMAA